MRLHGDREPKQPQHGTTGGAGCRSGAPNEVWSYGEDVYKICKKYMRRREEMREYTRSLMKEAHEKGTPVMRTCFYEFPKDEKTWTLKDQYMYGGLYLCAPVQEAGARRRQVYFPAGARWRDVETGEEYAGGETKMVEAPFERMPVFARL
jgi:alpha-D-xyloside xylohydrolase